MDIKFSKFYLENQVPPGALDVWLHTIKEAFRKGLVRPGYRDGVVLVDTGVRLPHRTVELIPGEPLKVSYTARVMGEEPRKKIQAIRKTGDLPLSHTTFVVLYRKDVLALKDERSTDAEWEVVAHLTSSIDQPEPMHPDTLLANHFELSGGTPTGMSPEEFQNSLRESVLFWKNRVMVSEEKSSLVDYFLEWGFSVICAAVTVGVLWGVFCVLFKYAGYLSIYR